jgi:hypothetical protein
MGIIFLENKYVIGLFEFSRNSSILELDILAKFSAHLQRGSGLQSFEAEVNGHPKYDSS